MSLAHNEYETLAPQTCPTCGKPYNDAPILTPFNPTGNGLLDLVLIAKDALTEVQAALEEEILP